jgi:hypothetical protein
VLSKFSTPVFDAMSFVHNREEDAAAPSRFFEECSEPTVTQAHLWGCQKYSVVFFPHILSVQ